MPNFAVHFVEMENDMGGGGALMWYYVEDMTSRAARGKVVSLFYLLPSFARFPFQCWPQLLTFALLISASRDLILHMHSRQCSCCYFSQCFDVEPCKMWVGSPLSLSLSLFSSVGTRLMRPHCSSSVYEKCNQLCHSGILGCPRERHWIQVGQIQKPQTKEADDDDAVATAVRHIRGFSLRREK